MKERKTDTIIARDRANMCYRILRRAIRMGKQPHELRVLVDGLEGKSIEEIKKTFDKGLWFSDLDSNKTGESI